MASQEHPSFPPLPLPEGIAESYIKTDDLHYHVLSSGTPSPTHPFRPKPLILLLHGFPELAFSWRKIMPALADGGYHVVAYDQRGYGRTTSWDDRPFATVDLHSFSMSRLVSDSLRLVSALGYSSVACVIGHDFGSVAASMCALMRGDVFKSVIMMSSPFSGTPGFPFNIINQWPEEKTETENVYEALTTLPEPKKHYKQYYSTAHADEEMSFPKSDISSFLRGYFHLKSAGWEGNVPHHLKAWTAEELAKMPGYYIMPFDLNMRETVGRDMAKEDGDLVKKKSERWLNDDDLAIYAAEWSRTGFQGGLNWYRVGLEPDKWARDMGVWAGKKIEVSSLFVSGDKDWGMYQEPGVVERMDDCCAQFKGVRVVEGAGHWIQQERAKEVVDIVLEFLKDVKDERGRY